ncbi:hypothetical protein [Natrinema sp. 74]
MQLSTPLRRDGGLVEWTDAMLVTATGSSREYTCPESFQPD